MPEQKDIIESEIKMKKNKKGPVNNKSSLERVKNRIWELDFLRGIALLLMIYFHIIYDMNEFFNLPIDYESGINEYTGKVSAILFMLISGISSSLSRSNIKRGLKVLGIAMIITIVSHLYNPAFGIKFGILHFLGISMLLSPLFSKINKYILVLLGVSIISLGNFVSDIKTTTDYFFVLGINSSSFISSDYYPLVPWLGIFLFGIAFGKFFYLKRQSLFPFSLKDTVINKVGERTLLVYILHQPAIIIILTLLDYLRIF